jgi:hypothetical protein
MPFDRRIQIRKESPSDFGRKEVTDVDGRRSTAEQFDRPLIAEQIQRVHFIASHS